MYMKHTINSNTVTIELYDLPLEQEQQVINYAVANEVSYDCIHEGCIVLYDMDWNTVGNLAIELTPLKTSKTN